MRHRLCLDHYLLHEWPPKVKPDRTVGSERLSAAMPPIPRQQHRNPSMAKQTDSAPTRTALLRHPVHIRVPILKIRDLPNQFEVFPKLRTRHHYSLVISQERLHRLPNLVSYPTIKTKTTWLPDQTTCSIIHHQPLNSAHPSHHHTPEGLARMVTSTWTDNNQRSLPGRQWQVSRQAMRPAPVHRTQLGLTSRLCHPRTAHRQTI